VRLEIVSGAGHSDSEPGLIGALVRATDDFRRDDGATPGSGGAPPAAKPLAQLDLLKISEGSHEDTEPAPLP
jgi:hypothetical protein